MDEVERFVCCLCVDGFLSAVQGAIRRALDESFFVTNLARSVQCVSHGWVPFPSVIIKVRHEKTRSPTVSVGWTVLKVRQYERAT